MTATADAFVEAITAAGYDFDIEKIGPYGVSLKMYDTATPRLFDMARDHGMSRHMVKPTTDDAFVLTMASGD